MNYGERIKELRLEKGYSQSAMADYVGKSLSAFKLWEAGSNEPSITSLIRMADFFEVSLDYLIGRVTQRDRVDVLEFERSLETSIRYDYVDMVQNIQNSLIYHHPILGAYCSKYDQIAKIKSYKLLAQALEQICGNGQEPIQNAEDVEININQKVVKQNLKKLNATFSAIQENILSIILDGGLRLDFKNIISDE